jgi:quercetin dioxygenase-like cupin family protein
LLCHRQQLKKEQFAPGVLLQMLGSSQNMSVLHWNLDDQSTVPLHHHPQEQFGYIIKGGFEVRVGEETAMLGAGDAYFIPADVPHWFRAIGETEAIDVFSPRREGMPSYAAAPVEAGAADER